MIAAAVETVVTGAGTPTTVFLPGLTGSIAQTRPFGSGVAGTRVFAQLPGGATPPGADDDGIAGGYPALGAQARTLLHSVRATRAFGVSMGAGVLLAALAGPDAPALERLVLCLPPAPVAGGRFGAMADALDAGEVEQLARHLRDHQPAAVRGLPAVVLWARRHAADLVAARAGGLATVLRTLPGTAPVPEFGRLAGVLAGTGILVIAQQQDEIHPVAEARAWAEALGARCEVMPPGAVPWRGRERLRALISDFLNAEAGSEGLPGLGAAPDRPSSDRPSPDRPSPDRPSPDRLSPIG